jgi:hypothetical protein
VYGIVGGYVTARLSPHHHLKHAMIYGWIRFGFTTVGAVGGIVVGGRGPAWLPVLLALTALPCAYVGGKLGQRRRIPL